MKQACFYKTKSLHEKGNPECVATIKTCKFQIHSSSFVWKNYIKTLCLLIFFSLSSSVILQAQTPLTPSGGGTSSSDPYIISSLENLYWIADQVNNQGADFTNKFFKQTADIDLGGYSNWTPIGTDIYFFTGNYDGNWKIIKNLTQISSVYTGLFGTVFGGYVKNLGVVNFNITGNNIGIHCIGGLIGGAQSSTIDNCYTSGSIIISGTNNQACQIGGLLGYDYDANTITNCYSSCSFSFTGTSSSIGGLVGQNDDATGSIKYCYSISTMNINETNFTTETKLGGFCGLNLNNGTIEDCYYDQTTSGQSDNEGKGTPKTTAAMQTSASYSGLWTLANWSFSIGNYPKLIWQAPAVVSVSVPTSKTYKTSDALTFTANFDQNVTVTGTPQLSLTLNTGGTVQASYTGGNGTSALTFSYTVQSGNQDNDGITVGSLSLNGGTIKSSSNIAADLTLAGVASTTGVLVDGVAPTVTSVSAPSNATYVVGQNLNFTVNYSEVVSVVTTGGTPYIPITLNTGGTVNAAYNSGSGTSALTFRYTVTSGNNDDDGIFVGSAITANGGTLKDGSGNNATLTLNSVGSTTGVKVDAIVPTVTSVSAPSNATYVVGQNLNFIINFSEVVSVVTTGGTPYIPITLATGGTVNAAYVSGSNTSALTFRYTVISGNNDADGIAVGSAITANGGTLKDGSGNNATLTLNSVGSTTGVRVDAIAPTVTTVSASTANATYKIGDVIAITVQFSESMMVTGTPTLALATGGTASYSSGSGSSTLNFNYTVGTGHVSADLDYTNTSSLSLAGGTIKDVAGNNAILTLPSPGAANSLGANKAIVIDGVVPTVTITSTSAAITYTNPIPVTVTFSESVTGFTSDDVTVNGTVNTFTGSGANYTFTVTPSGQGLVTVAIAAGVAQDAAGNLSTAATSLTRTFDSVNPTVVLSTTAPSSTNAAIPVTVTFSENVTGLELSDFSVTNLTLSALSGSGKTYTLTATPSTQGAVSISLPNASALDVAQLGNVASNQLNFNFDNVAPTVSITSASNSTTNASPIAVTITFSESVTGFVAGDISITNGTPSGFTGTGTTYTVNIAPSGQGLVTVAIAAGVAQDAAGNLSTAATSLTRTFDNAAPTVSITSTAFSTTNVSPIPVTITFSEPVTGFAVNDLSLINCTASGFTGSGTTYTVNIIPSGQVTVTVYVGVNVAADGAGNTNTVTAQLNRTFDTVAPDVSITSASASVTNVSPIPVTITFNEPVNYFDVTDLSLTNCTASDFNGSGSSYTVKISPSGQGAVVVNVAAGVATDGMGHPNTAATQLSRTFDNVAPVISGVVNNGTYTSAQSPTFNEGTATLTKNGGTAAAYLSGTAINATGSYVLTATDAAGNSTTASFTITLSTGIDDERKPSLAVYPNPCTDGFKVSGIDAPANVIITDLTGRVVVTTMVEVDGDVPVGHLKQGTYLVKVNERVLKLIKK
jgi:hypothetical protein